MLLVLGGADEGAEFAVVARDAEEVAEVFEVFHVFAEAASGEVDLVVHFLLVAVLVGEEE